MGSYVDITKGKFPAEANDIQQIVEAWSGRRNINQSVLTNDPINYALTARNQDPAGRAVIVYAPDGTTILFQIDATGVKLSPDGTAATTPVSAANATLTNPTFINPTLDGTVAGTGIGSGSSQLAAGNHVHDANQETWGSITVTAIGTYVVPQTGISHIFMNVGSAGAIVQLPAASASANRAPITVVNTGSADITVTSVSGSVPSLSVDTTTGAALGSGILAPGDSAGFKADAGAVAAWQVVS